MYNREAQWPDGEGVKLQIRKSGEGVDLQIRKSGFKRWLGPCVVFLGKTLSPHGASNYSGMQLVIVNSQVLYIKIVT